MQSIHYSFNDTILNDKREHQYFQTLIDQRLIQNYHPSRIHNVESPFEFQILEHAQSKFNHDNPFFDDYFSIPELHMSTNISFIDYVKSKIFDLNV